MSYAQDFAALLNIKFQEAGSHASHMFTVKEGRVYDKVVQSLESGQSSSVHAFINKETGEVFKPSSWKVPAKDARFPNIESAAQSADLYGFYLYK